MCIIWLNQFYTSDQELHVYFTNANLKLGKGCTERCYLNYVISSIWYGIGRSDRNQGI